MPLVRVEVRNEYGLGAPEMYMEAKNNDEPKEILEGVTIAGLVGLLRQLGDLADFAAEVFHGLQEEVMMTCSRSRRLMDLVQRIEAEVVPIEKAVMAQQSHLHLAYTAGLNWHAPARYEQNHFVYCDIPQFIYDSYEDCRNPPQFHLLDRFDSGGPGTCFKRYSDPTIFNNASKASLDATSTGEVARYNKVEKSKAVLKHGKKQRSWPRNGEVLEGASFAYHSARMQFLPSNTSPCQPISTYYAALRSNLYEQSNSNQRNEPGCSKDDACSSYSMQPKEEKSRGFISSSQKSHGSDGLDQNLLQEKVRDACANIQINLTQEQGASTSHSDNWGEETAIIEPAMQLPCSSPPLAHMKISFQPIDGFRTSKLKLKFMEGIVDHQGSIDALPSFQLVPVVSNTRLNVDSDTDDDDKLCRSSSPSLSDDSHSHHSESSSDSLCRISLAEGNSCHDQNLEAENWQKSKQFIPEKSVAQREANGGKNIDENNLLNQIRTKLMCLRPTVPAKPTVPSGSSTTVQLMTILDKANAIRQVVGSDDGDNWSDA